MEKPNGLMDARPAREAMPLGLCDSAALSLIEFAAIAALLFAIVNVAIASSDSTPPQLASASGDQAARVAKDLQSLVERTGSSGWGTRVDALAADDRPGFANSAREVDTQAIALLSRGSRESSLANGALDFPDLSVAYGVREFAFNLRATPGFAAESTAAFAEAGLSDVRVVFAAPGAAASGEGAWEAGLLDSMAIAFENSTHDPLTGIGSLIDSASGSTDVVDVLAPRDLGFAFQENATLSGAVGVHGWHAFPADDGGWLARFGNRDGRAYSAKENDRLASPPIVATGLSSITVSWRERVQGDANFLGIPLDYGFVEIGTGLAGELVAWVALPETSVDSNGAWVTRSATYTPLSPFEGEIRVGFHWSSDETGSATGGWEIDDIVVSDEAGTTLWSNDFEPTRRSVDTVVVGSGSPLSAFESALAQGAMDAFVKRGGSLVLLATDTGASGGGDVFQDLFGIERGATLGTTISPKFPSSVIETPNDLRVGWYRATGTWTVDAGHASDYEAALTSDAGTTLIASRIGAFGDGAVLATAYRSSFQPAFEGGRFLANALMFTAYRPWYAESGPAIPEDAAVGVASSSLLAGEGVTFESMRLTLHAWYDPGWPWNS